MASIRLRRVTGFECRANDVVFHPPTATADLAHTLVFFPGDVQDYPEVMQAHRDNKNYIKWNLDNMARMLSENYPTHYIVVVKPARIEYKSFSCYDNFVPSNNAGVPEHTPTHHSLHHLERLLQGVSNRVRAMPRSELLEIMTIAALSEHVDIEAVHSVPATVPSDLSKPNGSTDKGENSSDKAASKDDAESGSSKQEDTKPVVSLWWLDNLQLSSSRLTLVGFSKGCVVLNQFIYEFHYTKTLTPGDDRTTRFISYIEGMLWLDGGHAGGKNTWITSRSLLETLTRLNINIEVHVSPYQVCDEGRPWIGREEKTFTALLRKLGAKIQRHMHNNTSLGQSLHMHFGVLANFAKVPEIKEIILTDTSDDET